MDQVVSCVFVSAKSKAVAVESEATPVKAAVAAVPPKRGRPAKLKTTATAAATKTPVAAKRRKVSTKTIAAASPAKTSRRTTTSKR